MSSPSRRRTRTSRPAPPSAPVPRGWLAWLKQLWRSNEELDEDVVRELQDRTWKCQQFYGKHWVYLPQGDLRDIESTLYEPQHCVLQYANPRRQGSAELPRWQEFEGAPLSQAGDSDQVAYYLSKVAKRHEGRVRMVQAPKASADPSAAPLDKDLGAALLSSPAAGQRLLYNNFRGVGSAPGGKDLLHDWRDSMGIEALPPSSCGTGLKMKLHQATVFSQMRMWAAAQGSGADLDVQRAPKGFLAFHSTGSGKTCLAAAVYQAFWDQRLPSGEPRPLMLLTTPANRDRIRGESPCEEGAQAKRSSSTDTILYYNCARSMFPSSQVARMSASDFDKRVKAYSFTQAGNRLRGSAKDSAEFRRRLQRAVIVVDEAQSIFAPDKQFAAQARLLRDWLLSADSDGATIIVMTATPGRTVPELFELLQSLRRSDEAPLRLEHFAAADGTLAAAKASEFRRAMAGRASFVDYRNNTNDYPVMRSDVQVVEMSREQREEWERKLKDSKGASLENAAEWDSTAGNRLRRESNMAKAWPGTRAFGGKGTAREVYARGDLKELHKYSAKLVRVVTNLERPEVRTKKQYLYSAFTVGGLSQLTAVLQARGWTNVYGNLSSIGAALHAYECGGRSARSLEVLERAMEALPGEYGRRFLSTTDWSTSPKAASPRRAVSGGARRKAKSPRRLEEPVDEEIEDVSAAETERRAKAEAKVQSLAMKVFNSLDNTHGRIANLLLATGKYNEGLDLLSVRVMHMFEPQTSLASEKQMEGRGRRYCSHTDLPPAERDVDVIHYFSEVHGQDRQGLINEIKELQAEARRQEGMARVLQERLRLGRAEMHRLTAAGLAGGSLSAMTRWLLGASEKDEVANSDVTEDEVRLAKLAEERAVRRVRQAEEGGRPAPVQLQVEAANAKDRRAFLEGLRGHKLPLKTALDRLKKRAQGARTAAEQRRAAEEALGTVQNLQEEDARMSAQGDEAQALARQFKHAAEVKVAELKRIDPALLELLDEYAPASASAHDEGPLSTDSLVHGVARLEAAPMSSFLQALSDSATDCMVLQALHARMGVNVKCQI